MSRRQRGLRYTVEARGKNLEVLDQAHSKIDGLNEQAKVQARRSRALAKANEKLQSSYNGLPDILGKIQNGLGAQNKVMGRVAEQQERVVQSQKKFKQGQEKLNNRLGASERALGRTQTSLGGIAQGLIAGARAAGPYGIAVAAAAEASRIFFRVIDLGVVSIQAQAKALVNSIKISAEFQQEIARVDALAGGLPGTFEKLSRAALDSGEATLFTGRQSAEGLREIVQAGFDANKAIAALPGTLQLAGAGMISLSKAADISTNILSGYNLQVDQLGRVNDVLVQATTKSNTNIQQLGTGFSYVAGVAASTNQQFENTASLLGVLANSGIKGSKAGRAVANALQRVIKPTAEGQALFEKYNVSLRDYAGRSRQLIDILRDLEKAGASSADVLSIFGSVAGRSIVTVLNQGTKAVDKMAVSLNSAKGRAAEFQRQVQDTLAAQVKILESSFERLNTEVGDRFQDTFKGATKVLITNVQALSRNTELLDRFAQVGRDVVIVAANILDAASLIAKPFFELGGAALSLATILDVGNDNLLEYVKTFLLINPITGPTIQAIRLFYTVFEKGLKVLDFGSRAFTLLTSKIEKVAEPITSKLQPAFAFIGKAIDTITAPFTKFIDLLGSLDDKLDDALPKSNGFFSSLRTGSEVGKEVSDTLSRTADQLRNYSDESDAASRKTDKFASSVDVADSTVKGYIQTTLNLEKAGQNTVKRVSELFGLLAQQDLRRSDDEMRQYADAIQFLGTSMDLARIATKDFFLTSKSLTGVISNLKTEASKRFGLDSASKVRSRQIDIRELDNSLLVETNKQSRVLLTYERDKLKVLNKQLPAERERLELKALEIKRDGQLRGLRKEAASESKRFRQARLKSLQDEQKVISDLSKLTQAANQKAQQQLVQDLSVKLKLAQVQGNQLQIVQAEFELKRQQLAFNDKLDVQTKSQLSDILALEEAEARRNVLLAKRQAELAKQQRALEQQAQLATLDGDPLAAIRLQAEARRRALAGQTDLSDDERRRSLLLINRTENQDRLKALTQQRVELLRAESDVLGRSTAIEDKRLSVQKEYQATLAEIQSSQQTAAVKQQQAQKALIERQVRLLAIDKERIQAIKAQADAVASSITAGIDTDVSGVVGLAQSERSKKLQEQLEALQARQEQSKEAGADTTILERRIEQQQRAIEQEREYQGSLQRTIELWSMGAKQVTTLGANLFVLSEALDVSGDGWLKNAEAQQAATSALSAVAGLGSTLAAAFTESAKERAKVEALINGAASVASFAAYAYSGFVAQNFLVASIQHGIAAAKFGIIAGTSAGASAPSGGGAGGSARGFGGGQPNIDLAAQQERLGRVIGESVRAALERPVQNVYNIDFGRSTHIASAPDVVRTLRRSIDGDRTTSYQPRRRAG